VWCCEWREGREEQKESQSYSTARSYNPEKTKDLRTERGQGQAGRATPRLVVVGLSSFRNIAVTRARRSELVVRLGLSPFNVTLQGAIELVTTYFRPLCGRCEGRLRQP